MHYPLIRLIAANKIPKGRTLDDYKISPDDIFDNLEGNVIGYVDYYNGGFPITILTDLYDGGVFEVVKEDGSGADNHIVRSKTDAISCIADKKILFIAEEAAKLTAENFRSSFPAFLEALIDKYDTHINDVSYGETLPLDEWLVTCMKENTDYCIIQAFDWHP